MMGPKEVLGAQAAFERKCNGKYNGMSGARVTPAPYALMVPQVGVQDRMVP